jgi:hypothetical protein
MARIRTIKPEFWTNERVMECSTNARLLFIGMWNFADDLGRLALAPKTIKAQVFPSDEISFDTILGMVQELSENGLLLRYEAGGKEYLQIAGWQHQRIDKPQPGKCPAPINGYSKNDPGMVATDSILSTPSDPIPSKDARDDLKKRTGDFMQAIVQAFAAGNSPNLPETSRAGLWLSQGYQEDICLAVITDIVKRKPSITTLSYFDKPIADAHASKAPPRVAVPMIAQEIDWDVVLTDFKRWGRWSRWAGPDLDSAECRAPKEMLVKYGLLAAETTHSAPIIPHPQSMQGAA